MKNLLAAQEFFKDDRFQKLVGVNIEEVGDGYAVCGVNLDENHFNADGIVQHKTGYLYTRRFGVRGCRQQRGIFHRHAVEFRAIPPKDDGQIYQGESRPCG